ncbi:acyltransferase [uncultured Paracoccus sp.]|uniref:acyltransferase family protein n=1 Tax=uncultured Paracoccus sp. TaxID=189685 RepID=UPI002624A584|nr:acyltransferase [uncultured Paracoccus sp.]
MRNRIAGDHLKALDGARGIAALAVMLYHVSSAAGSGAWLSGAFLAVDFFFLLSGFVVARSYEARLRDGGMTLRSFVWTRVVRLYPLYIAASVIGLTYFSTKIVLGTPDAPTIRELAATFPGAITLLHQPNAISWGFVEFPFAPSAWSLSFEFWFTIIYAAIVPKLSTRALSGIAIIAFALLSQQANLVGSIDMGYDRRTLVGGVARFWFSFTLGVIIHRLGHLILQQRPLSLVLGVPAFAFVAIPHDAVGLGLAWISLVFPAALIVGAASECRGWTAPTLDHLGRLSYAIYILHAPIILFTFAIFKVALGDAWNSNPILLATSTIVAALVASAVATYLFDEPLRAYLRKRGSHRILVKVAKN